jgi:hypothetical protein
MEISNTGDESVACVGFRHTFYILPEFIHVVQWFRVARSLVFCVVS